MALRAFAVLETGENTGGIVFAERAVVARRMGASQFGDGDFSGVSCRRAPWADEWADKKEDVPARVCIENGWHFECCGCGATIDEDWLAEEGLPLRDVTGTQNSKVYCSEICECRDKLNAAVRRDLERRAIMALKAFVLKRFPGAEFASKDNWVPHAYATDARGTWQVQETVVSFCFPGMVIGPATCRLDRLQGNERIVGPVLPRFSCCIGDKEAFETWAASPKSRAKPL